MEIISNEQGNFIVPTDIFMLFLIKIPFNHLAAVMMGKHLYSKNEPIDRQTFARNLRNARKDAGLTQEDLVKITHLSQAFISAVEAGKANISLDNCSNLSDAVGVPLRDLLDPKKK